MQATPTFALRDWNTGVLAGHRFPDVKDQLFYYMDHPDETVPEGESLNTYLQRFIPFTKDLAESPDTHLVVGHARGTQVIHGLAAGGGDWIHPGPLKNKPIIDPGDRMIVTSDWTTIPSHIPEQTDNS
jgi:broad specificity phosphatase PhoE